MEHFFNPVFDPEDITKTWKARKAELKLEEMQGFSAMLFKYLHDDILSRRDQIYADLAAVVRNAHEADRLATPLWSYMTTKFRENTPSYYQQRGEVRRRGLDWTISNPENTRHESVGKVIRKTDLCDRLSLMFGSDFVVRDELAPHVETSADWVASRRQLVLVYLPRGPSPRTATQRAAIYARFGYTLPEGAPVLYAGEGLLDVTPPPQPPREDPPPIVRPGRQTPQCWGWGGNATCYCNCDESDME